MGLDDEPPDDRTPRGPSPLQSPAEAFHEILNRQGYGFQYGLLDHIARTAAPWRIDAAEFPVSVRGGSATHIDFILLLQGDDDQGNAVPLRLVCECKRANPALVDWCFVRLPHVPFEKVVAAEWVRVRSSPPEIYAGLNMKNRWESAEVFNMGFPVKGHAKGFPNGHNKTALDDAVAQVFRASNGFMEFLGGQPQLLARLGNQDSVGRVIPAVFTTARLWRSDVDLSESDLMSGDAPVGSLTPVPWLWLKQNLSPQLRHSLKRWDDYMRDDGPRRSLEAFVLHDYSRSVAIVSAAGVSDFLLNLSKRFWNLDS